MGCNLCGIVSSAGKSALCDKCGHGLCSRFYAGMLPTRVYAWLRNNGGLKDGTMFDPVWFFSRLMDTSKYKRLPKFVQDALAGLVENSNGYFGQLVTFRRMSDVPSLEHFMVVLGLSSCYGRSGVCV